MKMIDSESLLAATPLVVVEAAAARYWRHWNIEGAIALRRASADDWDESIRHFELLDRKKSFPAGVLGWLLFGSPHPILTPSEAEAISGADIATLSGTPPVSVCWCEPPPPLLSAPVTWDDYVKLPEMQCGKIIYQTPGPWLDERVNRRWKLDAMQVLDTGRFSESDLARYRAAGVEIIDKNHHDFESWKATMLPHDYVAPKVLAMEVQIAAISFAVHEEGETGQVLFQETMGAGTSFEESATNFLRYMRNLSEYKPKPIRFNASAEVLEAMRASEQYRARPEEKRSALQALNLDRRLARAVWRCSPFSQRRLARRIAVRLGLGYRIVSDARPLIPPSRHTESVLKIAAGALLLFSVAGCGLLHDYVLGWSFLASAVGVWFFWQRVA